MSGFQFGLNIKKKGGPVLAKPRAVAPSRPMAGGGVGLAAFGDHSSDEDTLDEPPTASTKKGGTGRLPPLSSSFSASPSVTPSSATSNSTSAVNKSLRTYATATLESTSVIEQQNAALAQDATVFDYDGIYDQLKAGDRAKELARKQESADRKPKYIQALLEAAETRKRDRQIADEKRIEREREREGEEFKDKEQFITPAYKAQKEAMRLAEEEDRKKEAALAKDKDGSLMQGFYRNLLDERSRMRPAGAGDLTPQQLAAATEELDALAEERRQKDKADQDLVKDARERGLKVALNEEGQIVDKVELLQGGLNVRKKPASNDSNNNKSSSSRSGNDHRSSSSTSSSRYDRDRAYADYKHSKSRGGRGGRQDDEGPAADQRSRMTEQIERQLLEQEKQREEEEKERQDSIREALKRKNQDDQVMDAKARYLARKAAAASKKD
ncbi:MAG: coiled-coil domain-containing protein 55-domain containing protein [Linnemannia gamsii]|nr:MAG: coiled-coil domain-containing protein 55-domain containing protein [Linnemannia gamsii]